MARKLTGIAAQRAAEAAAAVDPSEPTAATEDALDEIVDEGQRRPEARISRLDPISRKYALLDVVDVGVATDSWIRDTYGGGTFYIQVYGIREDGKYGYIKKQSRQVNVDSSISFKGSIRERVAQGAINAPEPAAPPAPTSVENLMNVGLLQLFRGMQDASALQAAQARDHSAAMMAMMERMAKPTESALPALFAAITPLLAPVLAGLMQRKDPVELATQIAALREKGPGGGGLGELDTLLDLAERLNKRVNGEDDGNVSMAGVIKDNLPKALDLFSAYAARQPATAPPAPRLSAPAGQPAHEVAAPATATPALTAPPMPQDEWTDVEPYVAQLVNFAENDADPHGVMMTVLTLAPGSFKARIRNLVATDDAAEKILARFPVLAPYRVWTAQLLDEFRAEFFGGEDDGDDNPETPDDADKPAVE